MNQSTVKSLIHSFVGQERILTASRSMIEFMDGSLAGGIMLSQIIHWSGTLPDERNGWFWKTDQEWQDEICISRRQVRKIVAALKDADVLETKVCKIKGVPTTHYRFDWDVFTEKFEEFLDAKSDCSKRDSPNQTVPNGTVSSSQMGQSSTTTKKTSKKTLSEQSSDYTRANEDSLNGDEGNIGVNKEHARQKVKPDKFDMITADRFYKAVDSHKKVRNWNKAKHLKWADHFRRMRSVDNVSKAEIKAAVKWYRTHIGDEFAVEAYCGESFRRKFEKIEAAMARPRNGTNRINGTGSVDCYENFRKKRKEGKV